MENHSIFWAIPAKAIMAWRESNLENQTQKTNINSSLLIFHKLGPINVKIQHPYLMFRLKKEF